MEKKGDVIAIDLGGTHLRTALVRDNKIVDLKRSETPLTKNALLDIICEDISQLLMVSKKVMGIGIASPGPLMNGKILNPPNIPLQNFDLRKFLEKKFHKKVVVENDANCVALAELKLGHGKRAKNFLVLTFGTGVGGGVVIDGKLFNGNGKGGELGHLVLDGGKYLEDLVASKALKARTKKVFGQEFLVTDLCKMRGADKKKAEKILLEMADYIGMGISSLISVFDPDVVVLAGGVRESGNIYLNMIRKATKKYNFLKGDYKIEWSKLDEPGVLGAGLLVG